MIPVQASPTVRSSLRRLAFGCGILALSLAVGCGPEGEPKAPSTADQALDAPSATEGAPAIVEGGDILAFAKANKHLIAKTLRLPSDTQLEIFSAEPVLGGSFNKIELKTTKLPGKQMLFIKTYLTPDRRNLFVGEIFELGAPGRLRINPDWIPIEGAPIEGDPEAPITIIEFGDFECMFCAKQETALKRLLRDYVGKVRLVYKYFSLTNHLWATPAIVAADCAAKQEPLAFFAFRDYFYLYQPDITTSNVKSRSLLLASERGLDLNKFSACYDENNKLDYGRESQFQGFSVSVTKIPTLFINGVRRQGVQAYATLKEVVDEELLAAGIELPETASGTVTAEAGAEEEAGATEGASTDEPAAEEEAGAAESASTDEPAAEEEAGAAEGASADEPETEEAAETSSS